MVNPSTASSMENVKWLAFYHADFPVWTPRLQAGRYFSQNEIEAGQHVVLFGPGPNTGYYAPGEEAVIGQEIRLLGLDWSVIGILTPEQRYTERRSGFLFEKRWLQAW